MCSIPLYVCIYCQNNQVIIIREKEKNPNTTFKDPKIGGKRNTYLARPRS
jgi:hypothetical protein